MTDTLSNKPKLQLRSGASFSDKAPSPGAKLLLNHGKPNFTIQRTPKVQQANGDANNNSNPLSPKPQSIGNGNSNRNSSGSNNYNSNRNSSSGDGGGTLTIINNNNNNEISFKNANGTATNGSGGGIEVTVKSAQYNGSAVLKPGTLQAATTSGTPENEVAKVVLRRVQQRQAAAAEENGADDDGVPEFIKRQRRIQERLAREGLDFENRRSGYFTQVMISPTLPQQRTSFVETMSSPAIVPSLEMPPPMPNSAPPSPQQQPKLLDVQEEEPTQEVVPQRRCGTEVPPPQSNGYSAEEEEVARAIEEVNKAVAGEDDEPAEPTEPLVAAVTTSLLLDFDDEPPATLEAQVQAAAAETVGEIVEAAVAHVNGEEALSNGHSDEITISHTNGHATPTPEQQEPSIPTPDPSGALGVNYEPKTVVSFSKDLGSEPNKYPDTVQLDVAASSPATPLDGELAELAKLKFDIKADDLDVQVTPVLRAE